ncbi:hypothetical protein FMM54_01720 [Campylobacter sp. LR185c]|uniref:hypothetical protein n=1 Tax=Campylobacter sp. LR185c TaxID=2014525 RepID=UPI001237ADE5|nr:hypothetical protein [Campylobacter sp. LR185c]KAA6227875.1 hypothetical protein FMM54_01720 [Campylobacter sp. LR185c]KAA8604437.1 hypothetical protein CGP82_02635 [Campylobacter sp. LR185c]
MALYKLIKNKENIKNTKLIIVASNINDISHHINLYEQLSLEKINSYLYWFYESLYLTQKKVVVSIYPCDKYKNANVIANLHRFYALKFGFNVLDLQRYYQKFDLSKLCNMLDTWHQFNTISRNIGKQVALNIDNFDAPKSLKKNLKNSKFIIVKPNEMNSIKGSLEEPHKSNSIFNEITFRIDKNTLLKFNEKYKGYKLIGIRTWNDATKWQEEFEPKINPTKCFSSILFKNKTKNFSKEFKFNNAFINVCNEFIIDDESFVSLNEGDEFSEYAHNCHSWDKNSKKLSVCDIVVFLLVKDEKKAPEIDFEKLNDYNILIDEKYNFNHILPDIKAYSDLINEYEQRIVPRFTRPLNIKIDTLNKEILATTRVKNHLAYKIGKSLANNSKSLMGYMMLPIELYFINKFHKENLKDSKPNLKPLNQYCDYKEALKIQNYFSYKLGLAWCKAYKNWYKGSFIKFYFEYRKLKKELGR